MNKIDKDGATPEETVDAVFDLMVELGAEDWQLDFQWSLVWSCWLYEAQYG